MKVLIAEDDPISLKSMEFRLKKWGHEPVSATDGAQALAALTAEGAPRLALVDWMMPELEGPEVCRRVREAASDRPPYIILLTAKGQKEDIVAGLEAGADDYVTKPPNPAELEARLRVGVRMVELQDQVLQAERNRVLMETAGAAAHEINQPLSVIAGLSQMFASDKGIANVTVADMDEVRKAAKEIDGIVKRMEEVSEYAAKPYVSGVSIADFGAAETREASTEPLPDGGASS